MAISWYLCKYCATLIRNDKAPSNLYCPRNTSHFWTKVCDLGTMNYFCKKCGTLVLGPKTQMPTNLSCPVQHNGTSHIWYKLGEIGMSNYACAKCGLIIKSSGIPLANGCFAGNQHFWRKM